MLAKIKVFMFDLTVMYSILTLFRERKRAFYIISPVYFTPTLTVVNHMINLIIFVS